MRAFARANDGGRRRVVATWASTWGPRGHGGVQHVDGRGLLAMGFEYRTQP
jgi:hypothetical protein